MQLKQASSLVHWLSQWEGPGTTDRKHIPLHFALVFLYVAEHPNCTYQAVGQAIGLSTSAVSRTMEALGAVNRKGKPGFGLIATSRDPEEGRRFVACLNEKGQAFVQFIHAI
jgi:DNA-binding MarR family transcriptional regulator